ncbi:MAG: 2-C-methyl-D-erythritol 4-phosphate cytidylyltransferase [Clostridia bacterium]|nr:2-C-methyl-D-erythritol 4-phosphate cytidylyltransferase [Clostridia bacterium]
MSKTYALIVAAGQSRRMQGKDKLLVELAGKPVLWYSLNAFSNLAEIAGIIVVTSKVKELEKLIWEEWGFAKVQAVCLGGNCRQESVARGLAKIPEEADFILIHDAARPLVSSKNILDLLAYLPKYQAVSLAMPVKDTIKIVDQENFAKETPARQNLWLTQTPQGFEAGMLRKAYQQVEDLAAFTDDASIVETAGFRVKLVQGSYKNLKITTPEDLLIAEVLKGEIDYAGI